MAKKKKWIVRLGRPEWERHTYERPEGDALRLLGSVRRGPQVGALAVTDDGAYVQVVGDHLVELNCSQIAGAIAVASIKTCKSGRPIAKSGVAPVVVVKRRRIPVFA